MAKGRMITQDACEDRELNSISMEAQLLYLLTLPHLDRDGLVDGRASWIGGRAAPERAILRERAGSLIEEWVAQGLVTRYEGKNGPVLFFHGFRKHNANLVYEREQESKFAPPPGFHRSPHGLIPNDPDDAGRLAEKFDARSKYHLALAEASGELITTEHKKIMTKSGSGHEVVMSRSGVGHAEHQDQDQHQEKHKRKINIKHNAVLAAYCKKMLLPEWMNGDAFIDSLDDEELLVAASWLWLYQGLHPVNAYELTQFSFQYARDPFAGVGNPVGYIVAQVRARTPAPLHHSDRAEMDEELRELVLAPSE